MLWWTARQLRSGNSSERIRAAEKLGHSGNAKAVTPLVDALKDSDRLVRSKAAQALGWLGVPSAMEPLLSAITDSDEKTCLAAANALEALKCEPAEIFVERRQWEVAARFGDRAVQPLIGVLSDAHELGDDDRLAGATKALAEIGAAAVAPLIDALEHSSEKLRHRAAEVLGKIGGARAVEPLMAALEDSHRLVRSKAAQALGRIGDGRAIGPLILALGDRQRCKR